MAIGCLIVSITVVFLGVKESVVVESKKYMKRLVEQASLHFIITGKVKETGQIITAMKVVTLHNPKLTVKVWHLPRRPSPASISVRLCALCVLTAVVAAGVWREQSE